MKDYIKRAIRTFFQGFVASFVLLVFPALQKLQADLSNGTIDIDVRFFGALIGACAIGGVTSAVSLIQNWLEDRGKVPTVLK